MGLKATRAPPLHVRHSSGAVETSERRVNNARLELHTGWIVLVDLYVLKQMPAVGMIIGTDFMHDKEAQIKMRADGSTSIELTVGRRRLLLAPGVNQVYKDAVPTRIQKLHSMEQVSPGDELVLCSITGLGQDEVHLTAIGTRQPAPGEGQGDWEARFQARIKMMRTEEPIKLNEQQQRQWDEVLKEFNDIFAEPDYQSSARPKMDEALGLGKHKIPLEEGAPLPRNERRGNLSEEKVAAIIEFVKTLIKKGYVEPSESPLAAPVLLVLKPDGQRRFTVDYRAINYITQGDAYMPPKPETLYPMMRGAKVFARMDARDGFWGIPMEPSDKWKTAFQTPIGLYQWKVMPMGLKGSPARFQRYMDAILQKYIGQWCAVFVDDVVIWASSVEEMMDRLKQVFGTFRQHTIRLKDSKCVFFLSAVRFLGHIVDGQGMSADRSKVEILAGMPAPRSVQDVRSLMGVVGFLRPYVPDIAEYLGPIQALLKKGVKFTWTDEHQACKDLILEALSSPLVLALPDARRRKALMTDASDFAMGATLLQDHSDEITADNAEDGVDSQLARSGWRPVAFLSKALSPQQARQAPTTREFFAMYEAIKKWGHEIANQSEIVVFSDHRPLEALGKQIGLNPMILRRLDELGDQNIRVIYQPAAAVGVADWLSRRSDHRLARKEYLAEQGEKGGEGHPWLAANLASVQLVGVEKLLPRIQAAQGKCEKTQRIVKGNQKDDEWRLRYKLHGGLLWHIVEDRLVLHIPNNEGTRDLRREILTELHDSPGGGHLGPAKTLERVQRHFHWQDMRKEVAAYCATCNTCQRIKPTQHRLQGKRWPLPIPQAKWAHVALDFVTALPPSKSSVTQLTHDAVLVFTCKLIKQARFVPTSKEATSEEAARLYYEHIYREHGFPIRLISDRGPQFTAELWQQLWKLTGTTLNMSTAAHAQTDGQSEGLIRVLETLLRAYAEDMGNDWVDWLPSLEHAYNDSWVRTTGATPFELAYGQHPISPLAVSLGAEPTAPTLARMKESLQIARRRLEEITAKEAEAVNERQGRRPADIAEGDFVYIEREKDARKKMDDLWEGPYKVVDATQPNAVVLELPGQRHRRINVEKLRKHQQRSGLALTQPITRHRFVVAEDSVRELQFMVNGRWHSMKELVQDNHRWPDVQQYCEQQELQPEERVGQLIRARYTNGWHLGRVAFYDPADELYQVYFDDSDADVYNAQAIDSLAYSLKASGRPPGQAKGTRTGRSREKTWAVQQVLDEKDGKYLVHWAGHSEADNSWVKAGDFVNGIHNPLIQEWHRTQGAARTRRARAALRAMTQTNSDYFSRPPETRPRSINRTLELFAGENQSFSKAVRQIFGEQVECVTLDIRHQVNPSVVADVLDPAILERWPTGSFDIVWASPDCTNYSQAAKHTPEESRQESDRIVAATLRLIAHLSPPFFVIENPAAGAVAAQGLAARPIMQPLRRWRHTASYCMYGKDYRKNTDLWTNVPNVSLLRCAHKVPHARRAQRGTDPSTGQHGAALRELHGVPFNLIAEILRPLLPTRSTRGRRSDPQRQQQRPASLPPTPPQSPPPSPPPSRPASPPPTEPTAHPLESARRGAVTQLSESALSVLAQVPTKWVASLRLRTVSRALRHSANEFLGSITSLDVSGQNFTLEMATALGTGLLPEHWKAHGDRPGELRIVPAGALRRVTRLFMNDCSLTRELMRAMWMKWIPLECLPYLEEYITVQPGLVGELVASVPSVLVRLEMNDNGTLEERGTLPLELAIRAGLLRISELHARRSNLSMYDTVLLVKALLVHSPAQERVHEWVPCTYAWIDADVDPSTVAWKYEHRPMVQNLDVDLRGNSYHVANEIYGEAILRELRDTWVSPHTSRVLLDKDVDTHGPRA